MRTVTVERTIAAPVEEVFATLTDHAGYARLHPLIRSSTLLREGLRERNGTGALREINAQFIVFREEILAFERPHRMDYIIRSSRPPIHHEGGSMRFETTPSGTKVTWTSTFAIGPRALRAILESSAAPVTAAVFAALLAAVDKRLTSAR
jgi:uncharacterized protein YndB with AHSA1/START domain